MAEQRVSANASVKRRNAVDFGFGSQDSDGPPGPCGGSFKRSCVDDDSDPDSILHIILH